jgi:hypothetical protein
MTMRSITLLGVAAIAGLFLAGCSDSITSPTRLSPNGPLASGGSGSGGSVSGGGSGGGGGGGGGSTQSIPQVAGMWNGQEHYDSTLSVFILPGFMNPPVSFTITEDAAGNLTGTDDIMGIAITGKSSSNGTIVIQDGTYYGQKITVTVSGTVACSDGSTGSVMSGKFQRKEGFGIISMDNCAVSQP